MSALRFIEIDGKRHLWREQQLARADAPAFLVDVLQLRREQRKTHARAQQPALFELKDGRRPVTERTPAGRYREPSLLWR